eukprot:762561-Hanusia_phi.AAC.5
MSHLCPADFLPFLTDPALPHCYFPAVHPFLLPVQMENEDPRTRCGRCFFRGRGSLADAACRMIKSRTNVPWQNRANLSESWRKGEAEPGPATSQSSVTLRAGLPTAMHGKSLNANGIALVPCSSPHCLPCFSLAPPLG